MSDAIGAGGYHWKDKEHVEQWNDRKRALSSDREAAFEELLDQLPADTELPLRIVDLGAGDGKVASIVLDRFQFASAVLVDFSEPMMEKGREELTRFEGRYDYVMWDMNDGEWPGELDGQFDAVVSSVALHHMTNDRKRWFAFQAISRLFPGGIYANFDLFRDPQAEFGEDEIHGATCATIEEAEGFLADAGYGEILVTAVIPRPRQKGELALMVGRKSR
jgi:SAM-dependent methyltransferase